MLEEGTWGKPYWDYLHMLGYLNGNTIVLDIENELRAFSNTIPCEKWKDVFVSFLDASLDRDPQQILGPWVHKYYNHIEKKKGRVPITWRRYLQTKVTSFGFVVPHTKRKKAK